MVYERLVSDIPYVALAILTIVLFIAAFVCLVIGNSSDANIGITCGALGISLFIVMIVFQFIGPAVSAASQAPKGSRYISNENGKAIYYSNIDMTPAEESLKNSFDKAQNIHLGIKNIKKAGDSQNIIVECDITVTTDREIIKYEKVEITFGEEKRISDSIYERAAVSLKKDEAVSVEEKVGVRAVDR